MKLKNISESSKMYLNLQEEEGTRGMERKKRLIERHLSVSIVEGLDIFHLNVNTQSRIRIMENKAMKQICPRKQIQKMTFSC